VPGDAPPREPNIGSALEDVRAEALRDWLDERPPREDPGADEVAGLGDADVREESA
jgi:hypothetical protein